MTLKSQFAPQFLYKRYGEVVGKNAKNSTGKAAGVTAKYDQTNYWSYVWDNQITYDKQLDKHHLNASFVQSIQMEQWEYSIKLPRISLSTAIGITWVLQV